MNRILGRRLLAALTVTVVSATVLASGGAGQARDRDRAEWTGAWSTAITEAGTSGLGFTNQSIRMQVHSSVSGDQLRIKLSNAQGTKAIRIGRATVGLPTAPGSADVQPGSLRTLTFGGSGSATMYKGADLFSDPLDLPVTAGQDLTVTVFVPEATGPAPYHLYARSNVYIFDGDATGLTSGESATVRYRSSFLIAGMDVRSKKVDGSVVVLGDSISDGFANSLNENNRWTDYLADRLIATPNPNDDLGVLNQALAGNRVTHDGIELGFGALGVSGLARLDGDVFGQTGVQTLIVELGVNDILFSNDPADRVIGGLKQLATQAHEKGLTVLVCTIGPFKGYASPEWTPEKEANRLAVNAWLRDAGAREFDGVIDLDAVFRDPADPAKMRAEYDSGDHIHPNDAGAEALADAVPLGRL